MHICDAEGDTPLHYCEDVECFGILLTAGGNPMTLNNDGKGLLEKAVEDENNEMIEFLISNNHVAVPADFKMEARIKSIEEGGEEEEEDAMETVEEESSQPATKMARPSTDTD